jgi:hypothetical protein
METCDFEFIQVGVMGRSALDDCVFSVPSFHEMHVIVLASNNAQHRRYPSYIR